MCIGFYLGEIYEAFLDGNILAFYFVAFLVQVLTVVFCARKHAWWLWAVLYIIEIVCAVFAIFAAIHYNSLSGHLGEFAVSLFASVVFFVMLWISLIVMSYIKKRKS